MKLLQIASKQGVGNLIIRNHRGYVGEIFKTVGIYLASLQTITQQNF